MIENPFLLAKQNKKSRTKPVIILVSDTERIRDIFPNPIALHRNDDSWVAFANDTTRKFVLPQTIFFGKRPFLKVSSEIRQSYSFILMQFAPLSSIYFTMA